VGPGRWPPPNWVIVACDVGQGDGLVVNLGDQAAMVIDAGPDPSLMERCLDRLGVEHVPLLVLTHFHADHVGGVPGVLATSQVDTVLVSPLPDPPEQASSVGHWTTGLEVVEAVPGQVGAWGDASWRVLWPGDPIEGEGSAANNASVVLVVEVSGVSMLLTGDVEPEAQRAILADGLPDVDVLKVPHHGSRHQETPFLEASGAAVALVSAGEDNNYGHPDPDLLASLTDQGMLVARTDQQGSLAVIAEGEELRVVAVP
jgi:competence protein ComEC